MKICYRGQQVFLKSAESQRKNKTAKRRSKFSQGTRYLPLTKFLIVSHLLKLIIVGIVFITTLNTKLNLKVESSLYMRKMSAIIYFTHFTLVYAFQFLFKIIGISLETNYTFEFVLCTISVIVYSHFIMNWKDGKNFLSGLY